MDSEIKTRSSALSNISNIQIFIYWWNRYKTIQVDRLSSYKHNNLYQNDTQMHSCVCDILIKRSDILENSGPSTKIFEYDFFIILNACTLPVLLWFWLDLSHTCGVVVCACVILAYFFSLMRKAGRWPLQPWF